MIFERKYVYNTDENKAVSIFQNALINMADEELKKIDNSFKVCMVSGIDKPEYCTTEIKEKGNKKNIEKLCRLGWSVIERKKIAPYSWQSFEPYYIKVLMKRFKYIKWIIYQGEVGLYAKQYLDSISDLREYPYIKKESLPVVINSVGGYTHFVEDDSVVKGLEILEDEEPLTREERYPKNSDKFHYGWIAPNGDTYACSFESHYICANAICSELFPNEYIGLGERTLEERGWVKISRPAPYTYENINERSVYFLSVDKRMTKKQINTLFDLGLGNDCHVRFMLKELN